VKVKLLGMLLGISLVLAACGGGNDDAAEPAGDTGGDNGGTTTVNAEKIFSQNCAACHGAELQGGAGPELTAVGSKYSQEEIEGIIEEGRGMMRGGIIEGEEATAVAEWLASKQ